MTAPRALNCPLCGGAVAPPTSSRKMDCGYCGRALFYSGEDFMPRYAIAPALTDEDHRRACQELLRHPLLPKGLGKGAVLVRRHRVYLPFYLLTGKRGGVLAVGKERVVAKGPGPSIPTGQGSGQGSLIAMRSQLSKPEVVTEEDSRVTVGDFRYLYAASALEGWNLLDTELKEMVAARLGEAQATTLGELARDADVVDVDIPLERIVDKGVGSGPSAKGELKILEMQVSLVYVPVATFTFRCGRRTFSVTRDELDGRWLSGQLPFRQDWAHLLALPIVAGLGLIAGNLLSLLIGTARSEWTTSPDTAKAALIFGLLAGGGLAMGLQAAWLILRTPFVVRLTPGGLRVETAGAPPKNPFAPLNAFAAMVIKAAVESQKRRGDRQ